MKAVFLSLAASACVLFAACQAGGVSSATPGENAFAAPSAQDGSAAEGIEPVPTPSFALPDGELAETFCAFFQSRWLAVEGAADNAALPTGTVFFADLSGDGMPELFVTYSAGMGKQTGLLAYDVGGEQPQELGSGYLAVAPAGQSLPFSLWGSAAEPVLYTKGIVPVGAAVRETWCQENFVTLADGQLAVQTLMYSTSEGESTYYGAGGGEIVSPADYESLRRDYLRSDASFLAVETCRDFDLLEMPALEQAFLQALEAWRQAHT